MCMQCATNAKLVVGDVLPGYHLYVATKTNGEWEEGYYGVVHMNDPDFIFPCDFTQSENEVHPELPKGAFEAVDWFYMTPFKGHRFIEACKEAGWKGHDVHGHPETWFLERVYDMYKHEYPNPEIREKDF